MKKVFVYILLMLPYFANAQLISLFAGRGIGGGSDGIGDGLHADSSIIPDPIGGTFDMYNNYYIASGLGGNRIRKIDTNGIVTSIAGTGNGGFNGDGGLADTSELNAPGAVAIDKLGNIYIADGINNRIRKVNIATGIISTVTGNGIATYGGDNGLAIDAQINDPLDICFDKIGNLYIADYNNVRVRKIDTLGIITTIAGIGIVGYSGDGGLADTSKIGGIIGLCLDSSGNLYLADNSNSRVFKINSGGIITTVAGTSTGYLYNGDNIPATSANIDPMKIRFDDSGNLYIAENQNYRIRKVNTSGIINTVAGNGINGFSGDGGPADSAELYYPTGVAFDACGNLYIPEANNADIRKVTFDSTCTYSTSKVPQLPNNEIVIYPNPATEELHIEGIKYMEKYRLLNIKNNITQAGNLQVGSNTIDIRALPPGMYFLEMIDEKGYKEVRKVVKVE